jgi:hypothetical protein
MGKMSASHSVRSVLFWYFVLFLLAAAVTCAAFFVFVPGPDRKLTFYVALSLVVAAEFVFFSHLLHSRLAEMGLPTATSATRAQVQGAIAIWFIATVVLAVLAVNPDRADTFTADRLLVIDLILTFLLFACAWFLYSRDVEVQQVTADLVEERESIQVKIPDLEEAVRAVADAGRKHAEHAVAADRVAKKLDTVRSAIEGALVSERALAGDDRDWASKIQGQVVQLSELSGKAGGADADQVADALERVAKQAEEVLATLKRRDKSLISGGG